MSKLIQTEAIRLLTTPKIETSPVSNKFPDNSEFIIIQLHSTITAAEQFLLDVNRKGKVRTLKCTYQNRFQGNIVLARVDINGPPHDNPDGVKIGPNHIHLYNENTDLKFAYNLADIDNIGLFSSFQHLGGTAKSLQLNHNDLLAMFQDFCKIINVTGTINITQQTSLV